MNSNQESNIVVIAVLCVGVMLARYWAMPLAAPKNYHVEGAAITTAADYVLLGERIDLNFAPASILETLPGIGPALAARIVAHRLREPFAAIANIEDVKGIGPALAARMADFVKVE